jgi:DNA polymerase III subunit epsilon
MSKYSELPVKQKYFFFDLETTGTMYWKNGIHQIAGAIVIDNNVMETFNFKVRPNPGAKIETDALDIAFVTREDVEAYEPMFEVYKKVQSILLKYCNKFNPKDKFHLIGYNNSSFDNSFFRAWFKQNGDVYFGSWFWADSVDVMVLASFFLRSNRQNVENFKLSTVCKWLEIEVDETGLHDALYDIKLTMQLYEKVTGLSINYQGLL